MLYEILAAEEKTIWTVLFFALCIAAVGTFVYFQLFEKQNLTYDVYTFNELLKSKGQVWYYYYDFSLLVCVLIVTAPVIALLYYFVFGELKKHRKEKLSVFFYICLMLLLPLSTFGAFLISTDSLRWFTHGFFALFSTVLFIIFKNGDRALERIKTFFGFFPAYAPPVYLLIYALSVMRPYE